jgi:CBS-domain-containing membrane protein
VDPHHHVSQEFLVQLHNTPVNQLLEGFPDHRLYIAKREDLITDVFKGLNYFKFYAVPVLRKKDNKYIGFLEIFDIVQYIVEHFGNEKLTNMEDFWKLVDEEYAFQKLTVNDIMTRANSTSPYVSVKQDYSLFFACELIARENCRRVAIINEEQWLLSLITERQLLNYFVKNSSLLGTLLTKKVENIIMREVLTIPRTEKAITGFQEMVKKRVQGMAVVDENGRLVGCLSLSDLKAITNEGRFFWRLYSPVTTFLEFVEADRPKKVLTCTADQTLKDVLFGLNDNRIHQLYVVDQQTRPIGMITISDVIEEVISV